MTAHPSNPVEVHDDITLDLARWWTDERKAQWKSWLDTDPMAWQLEQAANRHADLIAEEGDIDRFPMEHVAFQVHSVKDPATGVDVPIVRTVLVSPELVTMAGASPAFLKSMRDITSDAGKPPYLPPLLVSTVYTRKSKGKRVLVFKRITSEVQ